MGKMMATARGTCWEEKERGERSEGGGEGGEMSKGS